MRGPFDFDLDFLGGGGARGGSRVGGGVEGGGGFKSSC